MAQICVLEASVQLKSCPQKFFNFLKSQSEHIPNKAQSENVHGVEIHKGDWNTPGSIEVDEVNKTITYVAVGGNVLELYKNYKAVVKVENRNLKLRIEYEKLDDDTPPPKKYQQFIINIVRDLDGNLVKG
ncbi:hypothetical protein TSUD_14290 [Trifolium subterraneum]|uniref:Bet v I/Major latex protein domain-containing protein n=1 Tax=Trifolium subterraneum TaxID=3900 RepID=A0A2Z6N7G3_TRISU|nr:hypothetical protein TSUD_14290 [Trifolium subterraneum]